MRKVTLKFPPEVLALGGYDDFGDYFEFCEKVELLERTEEDTYHLVHAVVSKNLESIDDLVGKFGIKELEVFYKNRREYLLYVRMATTKFVTDLMDLLGFRFYSTVPEIYSRHGFIMNIYIHHENIKKLTKALRDLGVPFEIAAIKAPREFQESVLAALSPMQRTMLQAAEAKGYYSFPRKINIGELAAEVGLSAQGVHRHLRKAENKIIRRALVG